MSTTSASQNLANNGYAQSQLGADPNAANYDNKFRGYQQTDAQGTAIATGNSNQDRANQQGLAGQLQLAANGQGPSAAQAQLAQSTDQNVKNAAALSAAAGAGGSAGAARYNAANQAGELNAQAGNQSAQLAAQQQQQAQGALGNLYAGMSAQDAQNAQAQAALTQQTSLANAGAANQAGQFNSQAQQSLAALNQAQYEYGQNYAKSEQDQYNAAIAGQAANTAANSTFGIPNSVIGGVSSLGSAGLGLLALSDERQKEQVGFKDSADHALRRYLHALNNRPSPYRESAPTPSEPAAPRSPLGPAPGTGLKMPGLTGRDYNAAADDAKLWTSRSDENAKTDVTNSVGALRNYLGSLTQVPGAPSAAPAPTINADPFASLKSGLSGLSKKSGGGQAPTQSGPSATDTANLNESDADLADAADLSAGDADLASAATAMSDEDEKTDVSDRPSAIRDMLRQLQPHEYEYKNPGGPLEPPGRHFGVMAQELEQSPVGKSFVTDTPGGKVVNYGQMAGVQMAGLADHEDRIAELEKTLAATKAARAKGRK